MSLVSRRSATRVGSSFGYPEIRSQKSDVRTSNSGDHAGTNVSDLRPQISDCGRSDLRPPTSDLRFLAVLALSLSLSACAYYSFTGATIPDHMETVAIPLTEDLSANPFSDLGGAMTRSLVDRFVGQTRLQLETEESQADALVTTEIQRYDIQPAAVGGEATAQLNRLTISAVARYLDQENGEEVFQRTFTASVEYNPENLATEEEAALQAIDDIVDDIFTAATSNW